MCENDHDWIQEFSSAVTVCDKAGVIVAMNDQAASTFAADGGAALFGKSVMDCHTERSREIIKKIMAGGGPNAYTIEKHGKKKLVYQSAWTKDGVVAGVVELSFEIPFELPHFVRD
jgi:transcriptional regulator with PAS, ATPase and Fis domain